MFARQLAAFCLISVLPAVWAQSPETKLVVFLGVNPGSPASR